MRQTIAAAAAAMKFKHDEYYDELAETKQVSAIAMEAYFSRIQEA